MTPRSKKIGPGDDTNGIIHSSSICHLEIGPGKQP
ncbi:MAG: hypothetical protein ACI8TP_005283 [Acidimicrobiales bacterium]